MKAIITEDGLNCIPIAQIDHISVNEISISGAKVYGVYIKAGMQVILYHKDFDPAGAKKSFLGLVFMLYGEANVIREDLTKGEK